MHSTSFQPEELQAVKQIFDDIVAQEWFDESQDARSSFARYLIETYSTNLVEPTRFRMIAEGSVRIHYSRKK